VVRNAGPAGWRPQGRSRRNGDGDEPPAKDRSIVDAGLKALAFDSGPPVEPVPELLRLYRAREPWLEGRLVVTPHAAWLTPESEADTRRKSAETMRAALLTNRPQNVITPEMY